MQYPNVRAQARCVHESTAQTMVARKIAALMNYEYADDYAAVKDETAELYFVPDDTLTLAQAREVGANCEHDLFGGVVPDAFVATKMISHGLVAENARAPLGWSHELGPRMACATVSGYSAFSGDDALRAVTLMLEHGPVRIKAARGIGGNGQAVTHDVDEARTVLASVGDAEIEGYGVVLEEHLEEVTTFSVGRAHIAGMQIAYCGTQRLSTNNRGAEVYGGSTLDVVRGGFDVLQDGDWPTERSTAIAKARQYDAAAEHAYPGFCASRRNYDVIRGRSAGGEWRIGVLEQSWRIGGATPAELAAFEAFRSHPRLQAVRASCREMYGAHEVPGEATIYFRGVDPEVGPITKYSLIERHENSS